MRLVTTTPLIALVALALGTAHAQPKKQAKAVEEDVDRGSSTPPSKTLERAIKL